ncbi:MAG: type I DNA topoisomerase [Candidatus Neomarinimicrobiota bacterium]
MAETKHLLVIVESPSKARTLQKVLGDKYRIAASVGHIRDLPEHEMGVDIDHDFEVTYQISPEKKKVISRLKKAVKEAAVVYLATDPDREGEAISWHLIEILGITVPTHRLVFHEVTREAIHRAFEAPRDIDMHLVKAQETRRILDRLVGYEISPILWRKIAPRLSAGRVQSAAIRLVVERERARVRFKSCDWWDIVADFVTGKDDHFTATLVSLNGRRVVTSKDFDRTTGELKAGPDTLLLDEPQAEHRAQALQGRSWQVAALEEKPYQSHPWPPFTTSTLQQEAYRKLHFSAKRTMQLAQGLYEGGYITYMRTDSTSLSREALGAARRLIKEKFGSEYLPATARIFRTKVKNAQEAHEAIRPAGAHFRDPGELANLGRDMRRLYDLIYRRTLACQMTPARLCQTTAKITDGAAVFQATGKIVEFPGYLAVYQEVRGEDGDETSLPSLAEGDIVTCTSLEPTRHETKPPARYTEATLIKELESLGIGRPSTYATIMDTIQRREYVVKQKGTLVPTFVAVGVVRLMERYFSDLVDYQFTARMEDVLDEISRGERESLPYLQQFYFGQNGGPGLKELLHNPIDTRGICTIRIGEAEDQVPVYVRIGRYGPYLEHGDERTNLDLDTPPAELSLDRALELIRMGSEYPKELGIDPETQLPVLMKKGRFGFYLQLGDDAHKGKQKSLLPGMQPEDVNLDVAVAILGLPRELGRHPETGEPVLADLGRYGPYVKCGQASRRVPKSVDLLSLELERALDILKKGERTSSAVLRTLGVHPDTGTEIQIKEGRYGLYITDGKTNVSLKKADDPDSIELTEAVERLAARVVEGPKRRRRYTRRRKKST